MVAEVARVLVVFLRRPGNQAQFSVSLGRQSLERNPMGELRVWMAEHLTADLSVPALARRVAMSPRNFQRVFTNATGKPPARYVEELRIETARRLLERTTESMDEIADHCGFRRADVLSRAFNRVLRLTPGEYRSATERFEVDSANAARDLLRQHGVDEASIEVVWDAIALHTTPGIPKHKKPEVALVTAGVDMDVLGLGYLDVLDAHRQAVIKAHPRGDHFKEQIIHAFYDGFCHKPETTWGTMNDDVCALLDPKFKRANFCSIILNSAWRE